MGKLGTKWEKKDVGSLQKLNAKQILAVNGGLIEELAGDVKQTGLVSLYKFEDNGNDSKGSNNLTLTGSPTYAAGKYGKEIVLDGSTMYGQAADNTKHDYTTGSAGIAGWIKRSADSGAQEDIVDKWNGNTGYVISISSGDKLTVSVGDGVDVVTVTSSTSIAVGTRYSFQVSIDKSTNLLYLYINGVLDGTAASITAVGSITNGNTLTIGRASAGATRYFPGSIDDLRFYNVPISAQEAANLHNGIRPGLVAHYAFGGNANDSSGNGLNGTASNLVYTDDGIYGKAGDFNGTSSGVEVVDNALLDIVYEITIEAWIKVDALGRWDAFVSKGTGDLTTNNNYHFGKTDGNKLRFQSKIGGSIVTADSISTLVASTKYHVLVTYDGANIKIYINGALDSTTAQTGTMATDAGSLFLGRRPDGHSVLWLDGMLDDVRIYNFALSQTQISKRFTDAHAGQRAVATTTEGDFVKDNVYLRDAENTKWRADGIFQGTGAEIADLATNGMAYAGLIAICTSTGSGLTAGVAYQRNTANDAWEEIVRHNVARDFQIASQKELRFGDGDNSHYVGFKAPATVSANKIWTLPGADGAAGSIQKTDGAGVLAYSAHPGMVLIHSDTTGGSSVSEDTTEQISLSYTLPANIYSKVIVMAVVAIEGETEGGGLKNLSVQIHIGASSKAFTYSWDTEGTEDIFIDSHSTLMHAAAQQASATIKVVLGADASPETGIGMTCVALFVFGVL